MEKISLYSMEFSYTGFRQKNSAFFGKKVFFIIYSLFSMEIIPFFLWKNSLYSMEMLPLFYGNLPLFYGKTLASRL